MGKGSYWSCSLLKEQHSAFQYFCIKMTVIIVFVIAKKIIVILCCTFAMTFVFSYGILSHLWHFCNGRAFGVSVPALKWFQCHWLVVMDVAWTLKKYKKKKTRQLFSPSGKENYFWAQRECISGMAYCLVCYNYKQKQFWIGILMTKQIVAYFKPIWIIFLGEM